MKFRKLLSQLVLRVVLAGLVAGVLFTAGAVALSAAEDISVSSLRDIILVLRPSCKVDSKWTRLMCAQVLHFNGDWSGVKLCRAGHCVMFEEVFDGRR